MGLLLLLLATDLAAQQGTIAGAVRSRDQGHGLASVHIRLLDETERAVARTETDEAGTFRFERVDAGRYVVAATLVGWRPVERSEIRVRPGRTVRLSLVLVRAEFDLNPLTVTGERRAERLLRAPSSLSVIDQEKVRESPALTALDHVDGIVGVDVIRTGLENGYPVARGFNGLFSSSLLLLTDHRIARTPSLRGNLPRILPNTNLDIERIEVVRGPASSLYGPEAAEGVLHVLTKSPIDFPGVSATVSSGLREQDDVRGFDGSVEGVFQAEARWAERFGEGLGAKLSGRWFRGTDWRYEDPAEESSEAAADACLASFTAQNPACQSFARTAGDIPDREILERIGRRDFEVGHWALDGRVDWRSGPEASLVVSSGLEWTENTLDMTEVGTSQTRDGITWYTQARFRRDDLFAQAYLTKNEVDGPDEAFFLRSGQPVRDRSSLAVVQVQYTSRLGEDQRFTYGLDLLHTTPVTDGVLNGVYEQSDDFSQVGAYLQSETKLSEAWRLLLAGRVDHHTVLDGLVVSPRVAVVHEIASGHMLRGTFSRAFTSPGTTSLFLDQFAARIPLGGPFSYGVRAQGPGSGNFSFPQLAGRPAMKSPFAPLIGELPTDYLPSSTGELYRLGRELLRVNNPTAADLLDSVGVPTESEVAAGLMSLDPGSGTFVPVSGGFEALQDLGPLQEQTTNTLELGYKGLLTDHLLVTADLYYTRKQDFLGPFRIETPNVFLDGEDLLAFFRSRGLDAETAEALAIGTAEAPGLSRIPLGVVQPTELSDPSPNLLLTVRNFGNVHVFGADLAADYRLGSQWELGLALSLVSDDEFEADELRVALNAPTVKSRVSVGHTDERAGHFARLAHRFVNGFPANSGVFTGRVDAYQVLDLTLGWRPPERHGLSLQLSIDNLFDEGYRAFPGAPEIGRLIMVRVAYGL